MTHPEKSTPRKAYMLLSPRSLDYARPAIESLFRNSIEPLDLQLITDSATDKAQLEEAVAASAEKSGHTLPHRSWSVTAQAQLDDLAATHFAGLPNLQLFRKGHPCWRKVTDPLLLGASGEELILLDPDVYFPNRFRFETTPATGVMLMWQRPNCLLPAEVVRRALTCHLALARHVDIGVAHWRTGTDLAWLDWMLGKLDPAAHRRIMHIEAIVWAAIAMRQGGGYLDPALWVCWHRTQAKRLRLKTGTSGQALLATEPWQTMKCFHAGGDAKWWVPGYIANHPEQQNKLVERTGIVQPFVALTPTRYGYEQGLKSGLRTLGYYKVFGASAA